MRKKNTLSVQKTAYSSRENCNSSGCKDKDDNNNTSC